jgi:hydroxypyruvate reductase
VAAKILAGSGGSFCAIGTDGIDGNTAAAGAIVDGTSAARAAAAGFDVSDHLARFDSSPLLDAIGDTVVTGPTGTNVADLWIAKGPGTGTGSTAPVTV